MTGLPAPSGFPLREAWPGPSGRRDVVHLVDWPRAQTRGRALCGRQLDEVALYGAGTARRTRTPCCSGCQRALLARRRR